MLSKLVCHWVQQKKKKKYQSLFFFQIQKYSHCVCCVIIFFLCEHLSGSMDVDEQSVVGDVGLQQSTHSQDTKTSVNTSMKYDDSNNNNNNNSSSSSSSNSGCVHSTKTHQQKITGFTCGNSSDTNDIKFTPQKQKQKQKQQRRRCCRATDGKQRASIARKLNQYRAVRDGEYEVMSHSNLGVVQPELSSWQWQPGGRPTINPEGDTTTVQHSNAQHQTQTHSVHHVDVTKVKKNDNTEVEDKDDCRGLPTLVTTMRDIDDLRANTSTKICTSNAPMNMSDIVNVATSTAKNAHIKQQQQQQPPPIPTPTPQCNEDENICTPLPVEILPKSDDTISQPQPQPRTPPNAGVNTRWFDEAGGPDFFRNAAIYFESVADREERTLHGHVTQKGGGGGARSTGNGDVEHDGGEIWPSHIAYYLFKPLAGERACVMGVRCVARLGLPHPSCGYETVQAHTRGVCGGRNQHPARLGATLKEFLTPDERTRYDAHGVLPETRGPCIICMRARCTHDAFMAELGENVICRPTHRNPVGMPGGYMLESCLRPKTSTTNGIVVPYRRFATSDYICTTLGDAIQAGVVLVSKSEQARLLRVGGGVIPDCAGYVERSSVYFFWTTRWLSRQAISLGCESPCVSVVSMKSRQQQQHSSPLGAQVTSECVTEMHDTDAVELEFCAKRGEWTSMITEIAYRYGTSMAAAKMVCGPFAETCRALSRALIRHEQRRLWPNDNDEKAHDFRRRLYTCVDVLVAILPETTTTTTTTCTPAIAMWQKQRTGDTHFLEACQTLRSTKMSEIRDHEADVGLVATIQTVASGIRFKYAGSIAHAILDTLHAARQLLMRYVEIRAEDEIVEIVLCLSKWDTVQMPMPLSKYVVAASCFLRAEVAEGLRLSVANDARIIAIRKTRDKLGGEAVLDETNSTSAVVAAAMESGMRARFTSFPDAIEHQQTLTQRVARIAELYPKTPVTSTTSRRSRSSVQCGVTLGDVIAARSNRLLSQCALDASLAAQADFEAAHKPLLMALSEQQRIGRPVDDATLLGTIDGNVSYMRCNLGHLDPDRWCIPPWVPRRPIRRQMQDPPIDTRVAQIDLLLSKYKYEMTKTISRRSRNHQSQQQHQQRHSVTQTPTTENTKQHATSSRGFPFPAQFVTQQPTTIRLRFPSHRDVIKRDIEMGAYGDKINLDIDLCVVFGSKKKKCAITIRDSMDEFWKSSVVVKRQGNIRRLIASARNVADVSRLIDTLGLWSGDNADRTHTHTHIACAIARVALAECLAKHAPSECARLRLSLFAWTHADLLSLCIAPEARNADNGNGNGNGNSEMKKVTTEFVSDAALTTVQPSAVLCPLECVYPHDWRVLSDEDMTPISAEMCGCGFFDESSDQTTSKTMEHIIRKFMPRACERRHVDSIMEETAEKHPPFAMWFVDAFDVFIRGAYVHAMERPTFTTALLDLRHWVERLRRDMENRIAITSAKQHVDEHDIAVAHHMDVLRDTIGSSNQYDVYSEILDALRTAKKITSIILGSEHMELFGCVMEKARAIFHTAKVNIATILKKMPLCNVDAHHLVCSGGLNDSNSVIRETAAMCIAIAVETALVDVNLITVSNNNIRTMVVSILLDAMATRCQTTTTTNRKRLHQQHNEGSWWRSPPVTAEPIVDKLCKDIILPQQQQQQHTAMRSAITHALSDDTCGCMIAGIVFPVMREIAPCAGDMSDIMESVISKLETVDADAQFISCMNAVASNVCMGNMTMDDNNNNNNQQSCLCDIDTMTKALADSKHADMNAWKFMVADVLTCVDLSIRSLESLRPQSPCIANKLRSLYHKVTTPHEKTMDVGRVMIAGRRAVEAMLHRVSRIMKKSTLLVSASECIQKTMHSVQQYTHLKHMVSIGGDGFVRRNATLCKCAAREAIVSAMSRNPALTTVFSTHAPWFPEFIDNATRTCDELRHTIAAAGRLISDNEAYEVVDKELDKTWKDTVYRLQKCDLAKRVTNASAICIDVLVAAGHKLPRSCAVDEDKERLMRDYVLAMSRARSMDERTDEEIDIAVLRLFGMKERGISVVRQLHEAYNRFSGSKGFLTIVCTFAPDEFMLANAYYTAVSVARSVTPIPIRCADWVESATNAMRTKYGLCNNEFSKPLCHLVVCDTCEAVLTQMSSSTEPTASKVTSCNLVLAGSDGTHMCSRDKVVPRSTTRHRRTIADKVKHDTVDDQEDATMALTRGWERLLFDTDEGGTQAQTQVVHGGKRSAALCNATIRRIFSVGRVIEMRRKYKAKGDLAQDHKYPCVVTPCCGTWSRFNFSHWGPDGYRCLMCSLSRGTGSVLPDICGCCGCSSLTLTGVRCGDNGDGMCGMQPPKKAMYRGGHGGCIPRDNTGAPKKRTELLAAAWRLSNITPARYSLSGALGVVGPTPQISREFEHAIVVVDDDVTGLVMPIGVCKRCHSVAMRVRRKEDGPTFLSDIRARVFSLVSDECEAPMRLNVQRGGAVWTSRRSSSAV